MEVIKEFFYKLYKKILENPLLSTIVGGLILLAIIASFSFVFKKNDVGFIIILIIIIIIAVSLAAYFFSKYQKLKKWEGLKKVTELTGYAKDLRNSNYTPEKIWNRGNITKLCAMGNGCSKWTAYDYKKNDKDAQEKKDIANARQNKTLARVKAIRKNDAQKGNLQFLISCPVYLINKKGSPQGGVTKNWLIEKAEKNAISLMRLKYLKDNSQDSGGTFEIKTYKSLATMRIIIVDHPECSECIVGHYKKDSTQNSNDSPLLIFHDKNPDNWGFGAGFKRLFNEQWEDAEEPTNKEWEEIESLAK